MLPNLPTSWNQHVEAEQGSEASMSSFRFRIRFFLPTGRRITADQEQVDLRLPLPIGTVQLTSKPPAAKTSDAEELVFLSSGYDTRQAAQVAGEQLVLALQMAAAQLRTGVGLSRVRSGGFFNYGLGIHPPVVQGQRRCSDPV